MKMKSLRIFSSKLISKFVLLQRMSNGFQGWGGIHKPFFKLIMVRILHLQEAAENVEAHTNYLAHEPRE